MTTPAGVKKPSDRRPKASDTHEVEVNGHTWTVAADALDDFELLDDLSEIDSGNPSRLPRVLKRLLGPEQYKAAMDSVRDPETGRVGVEAGAEFVGALFEALPNS